MGDLVVGELDGLAVGVPVSPTVVGLLVTGGPVGSSVGFTVVGDLDVGDSVTMLLGLAVGTAVAGISVDGGRDGPVGAKVSGSVGAKVSGFTLFVGRVG